MALMEEEPLIHRNSRMYHVTTISTTSDFNSRENTDSSCHGWLCDLLDLLDDTWMLYLPGGKIGLTSSWLVH